MSILEKPEETIIPYLPDIYSIRRAEKRCGIAIHPGSGGKGKIWPLKRFIGLAGYLQGPLTFILGPAEIEAGYRKNIPENFSVVYPETISELCGFLAGAAFYIGCDSGASHCAAWAGTESLVLFGPSDPRIWKPMGCKSTGVLAPGGDINRIEIGDVLKKVPSIFFLKE